MLITAEIGSHWKGDYELLEAILIHCKKIGFDYVKFQSMKAEKIARHPELEYYEKSSITPDNIKRVDEICKRVGIEWYCTPTYIQAVDFLNPYVNIFKIAVSDSENDELKDKIFSTGKKVIISTQKPFKHSDKRIINLYCIPRYPTLYKDINFDLMRYFDGYSCHTPDFRAVLNAVYVGIEYLEIHITPGKEIFFLDNPVSFSITECYDLVRYARIIEDWRNSSGSLEFEPVPKKSIS